MRRAERAEMVINHQKGHYELFVKSGGKGYAPGYVQHHWVDVVQTVAVGCQSSELRVATEARDDLTDTVKDDVELGVRIGRAMKDGEECFSATVSDSDDRDLHFFFVARSEAEVVEKLITAFNQGEVMSRKIFVTNVPVRAHVDAWVEIPNDPEDFNDAIAEALKEGKFTYEKSTLPMEEVEVDGPVLDKWEFSTPLEET